MAGDLYRFFWPVSESGYQWVDGEVGSGQAAGEKVRVLLPMRGGAGAPLREYDPLQEPLLYRAFAEVPLTEEGLLAFATRSGLLGVQEPFNVRLPGREEPLVGIGGESLFQWQMAASRMRH